jgi:small-conductance mechanosensitive channel
MAPFAHASFPSLSLEPLLSALVTFTLGFVIARLASSAIIKALLKHVTPQQAMLLRRTIFYLIIALFTASAFENLGFNLSTLLGAAGILTVAIGIASQTSMSNIISGIFMIGERPFEVGHTIKIHDMQGEILSIDLLSVKMRTPENTLVRIPNETLIKSLITNMSFFPIRRFDFRVGVTYKADLEQVKAILMAVANKNPLCLTEPKPTLQKVELADCSINLEFSIWCSRSNYLDLRTSIKMEIKKAFEEYNIEIPGPSQTLLNCRDSEPLPVKIIPS